MRNILPAHQARAGNDPNFPSTPGKTEWHKHPLQWEPCRRSGSGGTVVAWMVVHGQGRVTWTGTVAWIWTGDMDRDSGMDMDG